jgi:hypothetical protein
VKHDGRRKVDVVERLAWEGIKPVDASLGGLSGGGGVVLAVGIVGLAGVFFDVVLYAGDADFADVVGRICLCCTFGRHVDERGASDLRKTFVSTRPRKLFATSFQLEAKTHATLITERHGLHLRVGEKEGLMRW